MRAWRSGFPDSGARINPPGAVGPRPVIWNAANPPAGPGGITRTAITHHKTRKLADQCEGLPLRECAGLVFGV